MIRKQIARVLLFFVLLAAPSSAEQMVCQNDFDSDGDIDGKDLAAMISQSEAGLNEDATELFAGEFGHMNCTISPLKIKLTADDFKKDDEFGYAVSISGDFAIIGARGDKDKSYAYIFKREGTGWIQQQKLTINAAGREGYYWVSVAIDGEYAIVGASGDNHYGAVQIFKREGTTWIRQDILGTFIRGSKDNFGCAVSIYGEYAVVGARGDSAGYYSGAVFIFKREGSAYVEGPEYETIALFGGNCLLKTIEEVAYANYLCDELGIDTISAGVVIGWAIECFQQGILTHEEIGREIDFSDLETVIFLLGKIARREGIGDLLAEGVKIAAAKTGKESERFAIHVKGLEWSGYECRNAPSMMLAYLTADVGAHHNRAWVLGHDLAGAWTNVHDLIAGGGQVEAQPRAVVSDRSAEYVIASQHKRSLFDALGNCRLQMMELGFEEEHYAELYSVITGRKKSWQELLNISERIWHLTRAFSVREIINFGRALDLPPARLYEDPIADGPNQGHVLSREDIDNLLNWYYEARGWNQNGIPTRETLLQVGLPEVVEDLEAQGLI